MMTRLSRLFIVRALLVPTAVIFLYRGLVPAFTNIDTDFPNYYTAGKVAATGKDLVRLYDDAWFQEQIYASGIDRLGKFSPFPPTTAVLFIPLSYLSPSNALRVVTTFNMAFLVAVIVLLARLFRTSTEEAALFTLLSGIGLINCFRFGQLYVALSLCVVLGYYFLRHDRPVLAGISFGILTPVKYFPIVFLLYFVFKREWRLIISAAATMGVVCLVSVAMLGWEVHSTFLSHVAGQHLQSNLTMQDPFSSTFQTFDSLLRRLFVYDPELNPHPLFVSSTSYFLLKVVIILSLVTVTVGVIIRGRLMGNGREVDTSLGLLGILGLLLSPAGATYHFLLLWLPVALLLKLFRVSGQLNLFWVVLILYAAIGFIPYSFFRQFDGHGLLTLAAYPRLIMLSLLFAVSLWGVGKLERPLHLSSRTLSLSVRK